LSIENLYLNLFDIFILLFEELTYRRLEARKQYLRSKLRSMQPDHGGT
jgi:hypothetical protein